MKTLSYLFAAGVLFPSVVLSAQLSFEDQTVGIGKNYGFSAEGTGFIGEPLKFFEKVNNRSFSIILVNKGSARIPINTVVKLQNANNDNVPTDMEYPVGSISWYADTLEFSNPTYTFQIFAGGMFYYPGEKSYQLQFLVDGISRGVIKTNPKSNWDPHTYKKVPFNRNSTIKVILSPVPASTTAENEEPEQETAQDKI